MAIHIGKLIKEKVDQSNLSMREIGEMIGTSSQNIYNIFGRKYLNLGLLIKFCYVFKENLLEGAYLEVRKELEELYSNDLQEPGSQYETLDQMLDSIRDDVNEVKEQMSTLKEEVERLSSLDGLLKNILGYLGKQEQEGIASSQQ